MAADRPGDGGLPPLDGDPPAPAAPVQGAARRPRRARFVAAGVSVLAAAGLATAMWAADASGDGAGDAGAAAATGSGAAAAGTGAGRVDDDGGSWEDADEGEDEWRDDAGGDDGGEWGRQAPPAAPQAAPGVGAPDGVSGAS